jgi:hypothetical protein
MPPKKKRRRALSKAAREEQKTWARRQREGMTYSEVIDVVEATTAKTFATLNSEEFQTGLPILLGVFFAPLGKGLLNPMLSRIRYGIKHSTMISADLKARGLLKHPMGNA